MYVCMYVRCLNTMYVFKEGGREKETLEMPLGGYLSSSEQG